MLSRYADVLFYGLFMDEEFLRGSGLSPQRAELAFVEDLALRIGQPADISVPIKAGTLVFTKSKPKYYVSSQYGKRGFCEDCGSRLSWQALDPQNDWMTNVTVGSLDNSEEVEPYRHIFVDTKLPWYKVDDQLPKFPEGEIDAMLDVWKQERTSED